MALWMEVPFVARPFAFVLVVHLGGPACFDRLWRPHLAEQLPARFIEAHHRTPRIVRQHVGLDHVLHVPDVFAIGVGWDAPGLDDPRVDVVFFRAWRTVSVLTDLSTPKATNSSASNCNVQWQRPSGGSVQAMRTNSCSTSPLILTWSGRGGCGL